MNELKRQIARCVWVFVCLLSVSMTSQAGNAVPGYKVIAYVAGWSMPAVIDPTPLTHINFAFAHIDPQGRAVLDQPGSAAQLQRLVALKAEKPALKIIVSIGGWMADGFSDAALTDASRRAFALSAVELIRANALDGIDIDWEYPGQGVAGIKFRAEDKHNFTLLLGTLREYLDAESTARKRTGSDRYVLSIASADREYFDHTEMNVLHTYLDWINIMSYDFFNSLTPTTGHHAGLYRSPLAAPTDRNADASVRQHLAAGIPPAKLNLGVAFYGRGFAGVTPANNGLHQPYGHYEGDHNYGELVDRFIGKQGFVRYWDGHSQAPYLWNAQSRVFITYDDPKSLWAKARYVKEHHLGGVMFWELSQDPTGRLLHAITMTLH